MLMHAKWGIVASVVAAIAVTGCGGGTDHPDTVAVTGKIIYNGAPLPKATVTFSPEEEGGFPAFAITNAQGEFELTSFDAGDGAVPGNYKVMVSKMTEVKQGDEGSTSEDPGAAYLAMERQGFNVHSNNPGGDNSYKPPEPEDVIPTRYKDKSKTPLKAEVKEGADNDFEYDVST